MSESGMSGIQVTGECVVVFLVSSDLDTYRCVSRCESDLGGIFRCEDAWGSCVWIYVLMSGCAYIIRCQGVYWICG